MGMRGGSGAAGESCCRGGSRIDGRGVLTTTLRAIARTKFCATPTFDVIFAHMTR